jgi:hypothetical protein
MSADLIQPISIGNKSIKIWSTYSEVYSSVCDNESGKCVNTTLITYTDDDGKKKAEKSAESLKKVILNNDLYDGALKIKRGKIILDNSWIPFNTTTIADFTDLPQEEQTPAINSFMWGFWTSGIMPKEIDITRGKAATLKENIPRYRDQKLNAQLELATLFAHLRQYDDAEERINYILNFQYSPTTYRPMFYNESVMLLSDIYKNTAIYDWNEAHLIQSINLINDNSNQMKDLEVGYLSKVNLLMLGSCLTMQESFPHAVTSPDLRGACREGEVRVYFLNSTERYNRFSPTYADNFIAVDAFSQYGKFLQLTGDLNGARDQYNRGLEVINFINSPPSLLDILLISTRKFFGSYQFDPRSFIFRESGLYKQMGDLNRRRVSVAINTDEKIRHLEEAKRYYRNALREIRNLRKINPYFYVGTSSKESEKYIELMVDYAEVLMEEYFTRRSDSIPMEAHSLVNEIFEFHERKKDAPFSTSYVKALFIHAAILEEEYNAADAIFTDDLEDVAATYDEAITLIDDEFGDRTIPPYQRYLKAKGLINRALVLLRLDWINGGAAQLLGDLEFARGEIEEIALTLPALGEEAQLLITKSWMVESDISLMVPDFARAEVALNTAIDILDNQFKDKKVPPYQQYLRAKAVINRTMAMAKLNKTDGIESKLISELASAREEISATAVLLRGISDESNTMIARSYAAESEILLSQGKIREAERVYANIPAEYGDIVAQVLIRQVEVEIGPAGKISNKKRKTAKLSALINSCIKARNILREAEIQSDNYTYLNSLNLEATLRVMRNNQSANVRDARNILEIAKLMTTIVEGSTELKPEHKTYFRLNALARRALAYIQHKGDGNKVLALTPLREIEVKFALVLTPYIHQKLNENVPELLDKSLRDRGFARGVYPILDVAIKILNVNNAKELAEELAKAKKLVKAGKYVEAKKVVAGVVSQADMTHGTQGIEDLVSGTGWDLHAFRAEVYHNLAIVYAIKKKNDLLYEYANSACIEARQSTLEYDKTTRIYNLFKLLGKPKKRCECTP